MVDFTQWLTSLAVHIFRAMLFLKSKLLSDASTHEDSEPYLWSDSSDGPGVSNGWLHPGLTSAHRVGSI